MPWFHKYVKTFELGFQMAMEYRLNFLLSLVSAAYPIFIQTFLWTAIFTASSNSVVYQRKVRPFAASSAMRP